MAAARPAIDASDERRRPRLSNLGSLSAGLIERGKVPVEVLYGVDAAGPEAAETSAEPAAGSNIIAAAAAKVAQARRAAELGEALAEERTRPRQTNFGSLSAGMMERGKVPRHFLTEAQVELLLQPRKIELEQLRPASDATEPQDAHQAAAAATVDPSDAATVLPEPAEPAEPIDDRATLDERDADLGGRGASTVDVDPAEQPALDAAECRSDDAPAGDVDANGDVVDDIKPRGDSPAETPPAADAVRPAPAAWHNKLDIVRPAAAAATVVDAVAKAPSAGARLKPPAARSIAIGTAALLVVAVAGWTLWHRTAPSVAPATDPAPAAVAPIAEIVAAEPRSAETAAAPTVEAEMAATPTTEAPAAVDAAADDKPVVTRRRPGAAPEEPAPAIVLSAQPEPAAAAVAPPEPAPPAIVVSAPPEPIADTVAPTAPPEPATAAIVPPPPVAAAMAPTAPAPAPTESMVALVQRGDNHLLNGDIVTARLYYERAAEAGDAQAMMALGQTYDPELLRRLGARGVRPDQALAQRWYAKAAEATRGTPAQR